jgi:hypothetical protein
MTVAASFIAAWALLAGGFPQSQAPDATVATLDVRPGERLIVTTPHETIRGRVLRVADDGLVLADGPAQHTVPFHDLNRVERRRDSIWNGALIGYGVGFGLGFAVVIANPCGPRDFLCWDGPRFATAYGGIITGPLGMAAGAITDALIRRPRVVFERGSTSQARIAVMPVLLPDGGGGGRVAIVF